MELKRIYRKPEGWVADRNTRDPERVSKKNPLGLKDPSRQEGDVLNPPPIDHFEIHHTGNTSRQNFSEKMIQSGQAEGFLTISKGELILHCEPEDLVYKIVRGPGYYCCHCGEKLIDANLFVKGTDGEPTEQTLGMQHVEVVHGGKESPDPGNPSGYRRVNGLECELDEKLQKKYSFGQWMKSRMEGPQKKSEKRSKDNG